MPNGKPWTDEELALYAEAFFANGCVQIDAVKALGWKGTLGSLRVRAHKIHKHAKERGVLERRVAAVKEAMGVDELIRRLSEQARGEDPATAALVEIAQKADMGEFMADVIRNAPGPDGKPALEQDVVLDLKGAKKKGLLKFVHAIRPTPNGTAIELESRPDALKAIASIQKGALDSLARIHGLDGEKDVERRDRRYAVVLAAMPPEMVKLFYRNLLASSVVDVEAKAV